MIRYRDKVLPVQPYFAEYWRGQPDYIDAIADLVIEHAIEQAPDLEIAAPSRMPLEKFSSTPTVLALLSGLASWVQARNILEIGSFAGSSALHMARTTGAHVVTIEASTEFAEAARANVSANGMKGDVDVIEGQAADVLPTLSPGYEFIFIDGGKQDYLKFAQLCEPLLSPRGMMVIDDVFFHGDALNSSPLTAKGQGAKAVLEHYRGRNDWYSLLLPLSNGMLVLWR